jgi:integrase
MKLTKTTVKAITPPTEGSDYKRGYSLTWDDELVGFGLVTTNRGIKSYIVRARIKGRDRRHTLGRATVLSADKARSLAIEWLGKIAAGGDPVTAKRRDKAEAVTLREAFHRYTVTGRLAPRTVTTIETVKGTLADWLDLPLSKIDTGMVERHHQAISEATPGAATVAFRYFRAAWNQERIRTKDATGDYVLPACPTSGLSEKLWNRHARKQRVIEPHQLPDWFAAVESLPDLQSRAYLKICLYTGCRRDELARLVWDDVHPGYIIFRNTKTQSHHDSPDHYQPIPEQVIDLLHALKEQAVGAYVFGDARGQYRGRQAFKTEIRHVQRCYGPFGPHDCRRTFISTAEAIGIPSITTKRLVNHSTNQDVTGGYLVTSAEQLRGPIQRIADRLDAHRRATDTVVRLRA